MATTNETLDVLVIKALALPPFTPYTSDLPYKRLPALWKYTETRVTPSREVEIGDSIFIQRDHRIQDPFLNQEFWNQLVTVTDKMTNWSKKNAIVTVVDAYGAQTYLILPRKSLKVSKPHHLYESLKSPFKLLQCSIVPWPRSATSPSPHQPTPPS